MTPSRPMIYFFADERAAVAFCQRAMERANGRFTRLDPVYTNMFAQAPWCCVTDLSVEDAQSVNGGQTWVGISRIVPPLLEQLLARGKAEMAEMMGMGGMSMDAPVYDPSPLSGLAGLSGTASGDPSALLRAMRQRQRDRERAASGLTGKYAPDAPPPAPKEFKELWNRRMGWS